jgi:hypothetical protein
MKFVRTSSSVRWKKFLCALWKLTLPLIRCGHVAGSSQEFQTSLWPQKPSWRRQGEGMGLVIPNEGNVMTYPPLVVWILFVLQVTNQHKIMNTWCPVCRSLLQSPLVVELGRLLWKRSSPPQGWQLMSGWWSPLRSLSSTIVVVIGMESIS